MRISLDQLRVSVAVPQSLIGSVRRNAKARIELPDKQTLDASDITIFPFANPQSGTFEVRLTLPRSIPNLFPGMHAKVLFELGVQQELLIPASSVVYRSEVTATYVVTPQGQIQFRHIRTGHRRDNGMVSVLAEPAQIKVSLLVHVVAFEIDVGLVCGVGVEQLGARTEAG